MPYHDTPYVMKSGRSALHYLLHLLQPELVYVPYYTCDALIEPFDVSGTKYRFYEVNELLEPVAFPELGKGEYFLYVNYMDLKRDTVMDLTAHYGDQLIVDCSQAFFMKGNEVAWLFNSCRKFFGVPDGSYMYIPAQAQVPVVEARNHSYLVEHLLQRRQGLVSDGYRSFQQNEDMMNCEISAMSHYTEDVLSAIDYDEVINTRRGNFKYLHERLAGINRMNIRLHDAAVPICYPLLLEEVIDKNIFYKDSIFIPTFWQDVLNRNIEGYETEKSITKRLLPLPIDHRYSTDDMDIICKTLNNILQ